MRRSLAAVVVPMDDGIIIASDARTLVDELCTQHGFALSPLSKARLGKFPPQDVRQFTDAVFRAAGLDPAAVDGERYEAIEAVVKQAFERSAENQITR